MTWQSMFNRLLMRDPNMAPQLCYGQDGEDLILDRMLERQADGFYVDVGAHHPVRSSNTYLFYRRGWRDININVECGVAGHGGLMTYFQFNEPALNTFDEGEARLNDKDPYKSIERVDAPVRRLDGLLDQYMPLGQNVDLMTVDVEGKDQEVLPRPKHLWKVRFFV